MLKNKEVYESKNNPREDDDINIPFEDFHTSREEAKENKKKGRKSTSLICISWQKK